MMAFPGPGGQVAVLVAAPVTLRLLTCGRGRAGGLQHHIGVVVTIREHRSVVAARITARVEIFLVVRGCITLRRNRPFCLWQASDPTARLMTSTPAWFDGGVGP